MRRSMENPALFRQVLPYKMRKGDLRKVEIIESAIKCIGSIGVENLTFEAVGKKTGIGKSHVLYHFPNLDELVCSAIQYVYAVGQGVVSEFIGLEKNKKNLLKAYIEGTFHWLKRALSLTLNKQDIWLPNDLPPKNWSRINER